jgi:tRNA (guanine37-N1)-methyltransferase
MVLKPEPVFECVESLQRERSYDEIVYMTADGERLSQSLATTFSIGGNFIVLCGHYKGIDERIRTGLVTKEISIGDFVMTGGELPAAVLIDAVIRLIPGVLNDAESSLSDSFQDGLLGSPVFTRPPEFRGMKVPEELLSGDHRRIEDWREKQRIDRTKDRRPDLLKP